MAFKNLFRGNQIIVPVKITDDDGNPRDLTGTTIRFRAHRDGVDPAGVFDIDKTAVLTDAVAGECEVDLTNPTDLDLDPALYNWEIFEEVGSTETTLNFGVFTLHDSHFA